MESFLLSMGLSFVLAKTIPYVLTVLLGLAMFWLWSRRCEWKRWKKWGVGIVLLLLPFGVYFAINPIYEGDFTVKESTLSIRNSYTADLGKGLLVLAKPGCPFCLEAIADLKILKKRNPKLKIHFLIVNGTSLDVEAYSKSADGIMEIKTYDNAALFTSSVGDSFPTFLVVKNNEAQKFWINNYFGAPAKDALEQFLK